MPERKKKSPWFSLTLEEVRTSPDVSDRAVLITSISILSSALAMLFLRRDLDRDLELDLDLDLTLLFPLESFFTFVIRGTFSFAFDDFLLSFADLLGVLD